VSRLADKVEAVWSRERWAWKFTPEVEEAARERLLRSEVRSLI